MISYCAVLWSRLGVPGADTDTDTETRVLTVGRTKATPDAWLPASQGWHPGEMAAPAN